jgi:protocatechuate 3,4-dioxygenase beta subunit
MKISRRDVVLGSVIAAAAGGEASAQGPDLKPTGQETLGPYYPVRAPVSHDVDLTHYPGKRSDLALGQVIELRGRVLDVKGRPLPKAQFTIWQANAAGRYTNPIDTNPKPLDPNFLGVASFAAGPDGSFRIRTVKPGPYPEPSGTIRTPHIHFDVINGDYRLVTQMYFPGESLNATDLLLSTLPSRHRDPRTAICTAHAGGPPGVALFDWDIVLLT